MNRLALAALALAIAASVARAACPPPAGPFPATFAYDVADGRRTAQASALIPLPASQVAALAAAVKANPTWTNLRPKGAMPQPAELAPLLHQGKLVDERLDVDATPDPQCPTGTRVSVTFAWSLGALARLAGGDAKDLPALFAIAVRDEVLARALTTPEMSRALAGPAPEEDLQLVRVAPEGLAMPADDWAKLQPRLTEITAEQNAKLGDVLGLFLDIQRHATALAGFAALTRKGDTPVVVGGTCASCAIGYDITVAQTPDGKGGALTFGLFGYKG